MIDTVYKKEYYLHFKFRERITYQKLYSIEIIHERQNTFLILRKIYMHKMYVAW